MRFANIRSGVCTFSYLPSRLLRCVLRWRRCSLRGGFRVRTRLGKGRVSPRGRTRLLSPLSRPDHRHLGWLRRILDDHLCQGRSTNFGASCHAFASFSIAVNTTVVARLLAFTGLGDFSRRYRYRRPQMRQSFEKLSQRSTSVDSGAVREVRKAFVVELHIILVIV